MPSARSGRRRSPFSHSQNVQASFSAHHHHLSSSSHPDKRSSLSSQNFASKPATNKNLEYVGFQRKVLSKLGYFGISTARILEFGTYTGQNYQLAGNSAIGFFTYYILHVNVTIKAIFLAFLISGYFGEVDFLDKIATLDYILCSGLVVIGAWMFLRRYPFYEILENTWKVLNSIYWKHGCPNKMRADVDKAQRIILGQHLVIIFGGCTALMIQYFPDPKYCNFTYSIFEADNWPLRLVFGVHEFFFMMMAWNGYAGPSTMCMYQGVAMSTAIDRMNETLRRLFLDEMRVETRTGADGLQKLIIRKNLLQPHKIVPDTEYNIEKILFDYKQLMLISDRFNSWVAYKTLFLHLCGGSQFVSDVFAATHVLRLPGTGFLDVWFYVWDSMTAGFLLLRVYHFMGMVSDAAETFLATFNEYLTFKNPKSLYLRKVARTLKIVSLNVGPCQVWPESVLACLDTMGNYYVCAALW